MAADQREGRTPDEGVDVVVPVYHAAAALDRCLGALLEHTARPPHRLLLSVDGPQPPEVEEVLARHASPGTPGVVVLRGLERGGFVGAVNRGLERSSRDVVLLNADTEVTPRWLEKLRRAAHSGPRVGTATPLSNCATICSFPEFVEDNLLPTGWSADRLAEVVERVAEPRYVRLPTGVGVCLYLRRELLDAVGGLDPDRFGLGYGEENELCLRATAAGFEHVADDATFIFHAGQRSFGAERDRRARRAQRTLARIDGGYRRRVAGFMTADLLAPVRRRILQEISPPAATGGLSVLHVVHGWPPFDHGGTESYAFSLAHDQATRHRVAVLTRVADPGRATGQRLALLDRGLRVRLVVNNFDRRNPIARNALADAGFDRELETLIDEQRPALVHVHHLAGLAGSLVGVAVRRGLPVVYQVQDWWASCARSNLVDAAGRPCPGPSPGRCSRCLPLTGLQPRWLLNRALHLVRRRWLARQVRAASAYVMGSRAIRDWYHDHDLLSPGAPVWVLRYGVETGAAPAPRTPALPLVFGVVGAVMPHKGTHVAVEAFAGLAGRARLEVWGDLEAAPAYVAALRRAADPATVELRGRFPDDRRQAVLARLDALIVPSIGLESFGIAAHEAMAAGVPVVASRVGALAELEVDDRCGATFAAGDVAGLRALVESLAAAPGRLARWREQLPPAKPVAEHAAEIDRVYETVLGRGHRPDAADV